ncbi:MAG: response regulator [Planctomycetes bacterium]|nr:response regulator [Planctomycetota bacterium]
MQKSWKEMLLELSQEELEEAKNLINELIQKEKGNKKGEPEAKQAPSEIKEDSVVFFHPEEGTNARLKRTEERFVLDTEGICSAVRRDQIDFMHEEIPILIKDISKHGIRFTTKKPIMPSTILIITFYLSSKIQQKNGIQKKVYYISKKTENGNDSLLYKRTQKQIYAEVRRVVECSDITGVMYDVGALAIDHNKVEELRREWEDCYLIKKRISVKTGLNILIVSTFEKLIKQMKDILTKEGYNIFEARHAGQASMLLRRTRCDIVISDFSTAKVENFELIKNIKAEFSNIGFLLEVNNVDDLTEAIPYEIDNYFNQECSEKEISLLVESLYKKIFYRKNFEDFTRLTKKTIQVILVVSSNTTLKQHFCDLSKKEGFKIYFVKDTEHATSVLEGYKIDNILIDADSIDSEVEEFLAKIKKSLPFVFITVLSGNIRNRYDYLSRGANTFLAATNDIQKNLKYWSEVLLLDSVCLY